MCSCSPARSLSLTFSLCIAAAMIIVCSRKNQHNFRTWSTHQSESVLIEERERVNWALRVPIQMQMLNMCMCAQWRVVCVCAHGSLYQAIYWPSCLSHFAFVFRFSSFRLGNTHIHTHMLAYPTFAHVQRQRRRHFFLYSTHIYTFFGFNCPVIIACLPTFLFITSWPAQEQVKQPQMHVYVCSWLSPMANNHFSVFAWFKFRKHFSAINTRRAAAAATADAVTVWESLCAPDSCYTVNSLLHFTWIFSRASKLIWPDHTKQK